MDSTTTTLLDERRVLRLTFGQFAWDLIEQSAARLRVGTDELVSDACSAYADRLLSNRFSRLVPQTGLRTGVSREVQVSCPGRLWVDLCLEAGLQNVQLEDLVAHAVLLCVADPGDRPRPGGFTSRVRGGSHSGLTERPPRARFRHARR